MAEWSKFKQWLQDSVLTPLEDKKMPVMEHLIALQVRLTRAVVVVGVVFVGTFFYADVLVTWLRVLLRVALRPEFPDLLRRQRWLHPATLHCPVRGLCPVVPVDLRIDLRGPAGHYPDGKTRMGRCAVSQALPQVGLPRRIFSRGDFDADAGPL